MATATNGNNNVNEENAAIIGNNSKEIVKILENTENAKVLEMVLSVEIDENEKNRKLDEIEKIYIAAADALVKTPFEKHVFQPFNDLLSKYTLDFTEARRLDMKYFGYAGTFWREAYNFPHACDSLTLFENDAIVSNIGLLTFDVTYIGESDIEDNESDMEEVENIYENAAYALEQNPSDKEVLTPFIEMLDHYTICFHKAQDLDIKYFGCDGDFWREAYNFPHVDDIIPTFTEGAIVSKIGLLTFKVTYFDDVD